MYAEEPHTFCTGFLEFNPGSTDMFKTWTWTPVVPTERESTSGKFSSNVTPDAKERDLDGKRQRWERCSQVIWTWISSFNLITIPNHKEPNWSYSCALTFLFCIPDMFFHFPTLLFPGSLYHMKLTAIVLIPWFRRSSWLIPCQQSWPYVENRTLDGPLP